LSNNNRDEYVICAAMYYDDGLPHIHQPKNIDIGFVVCGRRHHNCFAILNLINPTFDHSKVEQGFLTSKDRFISRNDAAELALQNGQIERPVNILFSEDLY